MPCLVKGDVLIKEIVSREFSIHVGGIQNPMVREIASHEFSIHVENGRAPYPEVVSRAHSLVVTDDAAPPQVTELSVIVSPTGDSAVLDWSGYDQWAVGDIDHFEIYFTDAGDFTDVSGMTPYLIVPGESTTLTLDDLATFTDHFFAVVAVDALGHSEIIVQYAAAYVLTPELASREFSIRVANETIPAYARLASREYSLVIATADPPPSIDAALAVTVSPTGDSVFLDWSAYNQWAVGDIDHFDIYLTDDGPFTDVTGMTPFATALGEGTTTTLGGLASFTDHFIAVVPVDALGNFGTTVAYSAAYVLTPELASREFSIHVGTGNPPAHTQLASREFSLLVPTSDIPAPVTGVGSGFFVETSTSDFGAVDLDWTSYNELEQIDVVAYRIYVGAAFFDDVSGLTPFATVNTGLQTHTLSGLNGLENYHFAVVAEDALGQFDPAVRSFSAQTSISGVGEVQNLAATSSATSISYIWEAPPETAAFLAAYRIYFAGATEAIVLPPSATSWEATGLDPATGYPLVIATVDLFGTESSGRSLLGSTLLPNPAGVALTLRSGDVFLLWNPVDPSGLVAHYKVYQAAAPFTDITAATQVAAGPATEVNLGPLAGVDGLHFAVVTVNTLGSSDSAVTSIEVSKQTQTIDFPMPVVSGSTPIPLVATATSGLPVAFGSDSSAVGEMDGSGPTPLLVPLQGGRVTVTALQDGNGNFWPADPVARLLRLPPLIDSFTANGAEIEVGATLGAIDEVLRVTALDTDGIQQAEFFIRPDGGSFSSIGIDTTPGNGFTAIFALDAYADGLHDLKVVVSTPEGITGESTRPVTLLLAPPPPPQLTGPLDGARFDVALVTVIGTTVRDTEVFILRNGTEIAGPITPDASGVFITDISLLPGDNALTARATNRAGSSPPSPARTITLRSLFTLTATPPGLTEGDNGSLHVTRNHNIGAIQVSFTDNQPGQLTLPSPVIIPDGATEASATVSAIDDDVAELDQGVLITALSNNYQSASTTLTVLDNDRPTLTVTLNRTTISEGAAPGELLATFTRVPATGTPFIVEIGTSDPASLQAPVTAAFAAFVGTFTVPINTIDSTETEGDRDVAVFGRIVDVTTGNPLVESNEASVTVTDNDGPTLALRVDRAAVAEGASVTARLSRNTGVGSPLTVALSVDDPGEAALPATVTFTTEQDEVVFAIDGLHDGETDGNRPVLVQATATGFSPAEASLIVTDLQLPDIAVARVTVPNTGLTDGSLSYSYRIENQGPVGSTKPIAIRVVLSDDPLPGGDTLIEDYVFSSPLSSELFFERSGSFFTPRDAGTYYLLVLADHGNTITEILETNNLGVSNAITIGAAYGATVETGVTVAPGGTPVLMTGVATNLADSTPAAFKLVNVHVMVRETERILGAMTNSNGEFSLTFNPLPGEGGSYTIGATHPGIPDADVQDSFTLLGFSSDPEEVEATLTRVGGALTGSITVRNLADLPMTGLQVVADSLTAGYAATATIRDSVTAIPGLGEFIIDYSLTANASAATTGTGVLHVTSAEGATLAIPLVLAARDLTSRLAWDGGRLEAGMIPGTRSFVELEVRNEGSVPTGPIHVVLPAADWLSTASASPLPSIAPGESASISLQLDPAADLPLTTYSGALSITGTHNSLTIPFTFRALSDATTTVTVLCEDEYTYFAASKPPLDGATVTLCDAIDGSVAATGTTGLDGRVTFPDIREGYYRVKATATKHAGHQETILVQAGVDTFVRAFLSRQTVEYIWTVVPTQIEDRYKIIVETVFETNAPAPVVTIDPAYVDLEALTDEFTQINFTLTNHGLIAADHTKLQFTSTEEWQITPLTEDLGTLSAKSSVTVPVTIRHIASGARSGGCGGPGGGGVFEFICGDKSISGSAPVGFSGGGSCTGGGGGGGGAGGGIASGTVSSGGGISCDPCILRALFDCGIGLVSPPLIGCIYSIATTDTSNAIDVAQTGLGCLGALGTPANCFIDVMQCLAAGSGRSGLVYSEVLERFERHGRGVLAMQDFHVALFGDEAWRVLLDDPDITGFRDLARLSIAGNTRAEREVTASERAALLATPFGAAHIQLVNDYCDRLNRTVDFNERGIYEVAQVPGGENTDFLTNSSLETASIAVEAAFDTARAEGYDDPLSAFIAARSDLFIAVTQGDGVCAKVKLQITQEAVMTRDAFDASLILNNNATHPIEGLVVDLLVKDASGADVTSLFGVTPPVIDGVSSGAIAPESTGSWQWTIIPSQDAAPTEATVYFVEGSLQYTADGETLNVPLLPRAITVYPNPSLVVKYFHQRDVFSDDPHTDIVEPSIPFSLGVMVENHGAGIARNLRIASGQPEIVDNEKGLLIDFDIIATEVAGQNLSPGLTADFGDIAPGGIKTGRWLMTSTLQGLFTNYSAEFEHLNDLGDERLSLIESVEIHEMNHLIRALGTLDDGLPDFLVNDIPDALDYPDTVHLSDGTTESVVVLTSATVPAPETGQLTVSLTAPGMAAGWTYLRIPDPGDGAFRLISVTRSDSLAIPLDINVWATDRTFVGQGQQPVRENILHLVDYDSTGAYSLTYVVLPPPDTSAPTSSITALPDDSGEFIELAWIGTDDTGVTSYDIYVSVDGGPFTLWLESTPDTAAIFEGAFGSSYAFYSIAHDATGNEEPPKTLGEATTSVTLVNQAPELDPIPNQLITEGQTLRYQVIAIDLDAPDDLLRFSVDSPDPGIVIDPLTGLLRWITTESDGGSTVAVTVTVTDGSPTPGTDFKSFSIDVESTNNTPTLAAPGAHVLDVGDPLSVQLTATDADIPAQTLTFRFADTPPAGMTLDPASGLLEWTPGDEHESQTFEVVIEVFDDQSPEGIGTGALHIEVLEKPGLPPAFDDVPALIWTEGGSYHHTFHSADPEGQPVTVTADISGLPGWVEFRPGSAGDATLYWNTTGVPAGSYELTLTASTPRQQTEFVQAIQIVPRAIHDNYIEWAAIFGLVGWDALDFATSNPQGTENLISYALGIDPLAGISPSQPEPRPHVVFTPDPALRFLMPANGQSDLRYRVEHSPDLSPGAWATIATKHGEEAWTGTATITTTTALDDLIWITIAPSPSGGSTSFMRLAVERLSSTSTGFGAWPGPVGDTLAERAFSDANSDGYVNLIAYGFGAASAHDSLFGGGIIFPRIGVSPTSVTFSTRFADAPRTDLIYFIETSSDLKHWMMLGWWTVDSSDQSRANFVVEPTGDGGTDFSSSWPLATPNSNFARLRIWYR